MAQLQQTQPSNRLYVAVHAQGVVASNFIPFAKSAGHYYPVTRSAYLRDLRLSKTTTCFSFPFEERNLNGANFEERAKIAKAKNLLLPSVQLLNALLVDPAEWMACQNVLPAPAREVIAYPAAYEPLGKYVAFEDWNDGGKWRIEVPSDFIGMRNAAIMIAGGFAPGILPYEICVEGAERVIHVPDQGNIVAVRSFPQESGNYNTDEQGLPTGLRFRHVSPLYAFPNARGLFRLEGGFIGSLVVCDYTSPRSIYERRNIHADYGPSIPLGIIHENPAPRGLEARAEDAPTLRDLAVAAEDALNRLADAWNKNGSELRPESIVQKLRRLAPNFDMKRACPAATLPDEAWFQPMRVLIERAKQQA